MENLKRASFSIERYYFDQVHINLDHQSGDGLYVSFKPSGVFKKEEKTYELSFVFSARSSEDLPDPFIKIRCIGLFKFTELHSFEDIPDFFYRNSIAILFPFVRAYISMVTNQANIKQIMLPTLNLISLEKPLRENTTVIE